MKKWSANELRRKHNAGDVAGERTLVRRAGPGKWVAECRNGHRVTGGAATLSRTRCAQCGMRPLPKVGYRTATDRTVLRTYHRSKGSALVKLRCDWGHIHAADLSVYETRKCNSCKTPDPDEKKVRRRRQGRVSLLKKYGLTLEQAETMLASQGGKCAICATMIAIVSDNRKRIACVDHDHLTGEVRALLCLLCNAAIGYARENVEILRNATKYLLRFRVKGQRRAGVVSGIAITEV